MSGFGKHLFKLYRVIFSPAIHFLAGPGYGCRFTPTCSEYVEEAIDRRGWIQGGFLAIKRLGRCHPFCKGGVDTVPLVGREPTVRQQSEREIEKNG